MRIRPLFWVGLVFVALPSLACQVDGNLVRNCGFDRDLSAWTVLAGTCVHDAVAGASKPGSAACASARSGSVGEFVHLHQCMPASAGNYVFGATAARVGGAGADCTVAATSHREADCSSPTDAGSSALQPDGAGFSRSAAQALQLDATTRAVSLDITCAGAAHFMVSIDDVAGLPDQIFKHGFEKLPPVVTAGATSNFTENQAAIVVDATITVSDINGPTLVGATAQISANYQSGSDALAFTPIGAITGSFSSASGTLTLSGTDTLANYQTALRSVTFVNNSENPGALARTITWIATDSVAPPSNPVTSTVNVTAVNDAPVLAGTANLNYTENDAATVLSSALTITDVDSTTFTGATVRISSNFDAGKDVLSFTPVGGITGNFASDTLTLSGNSSLANYQTALRSVRYVNNSDNPSALTRSVTWQVNDGGASNNLSNAPVSTIAVTVANDGAIGVVPSGSPFAITGNVRRSLAAGTLLAGATDPENNTPLTTQLFGVPTNGATVVVNSNGSFTYNPAAGYDGAATFQFVVCDSLAACGAPVTVSVNITGMIWFIDDSVAGGGTGRLTDPMNSIATFQAINNGSGNNPAANDRIFLYNGTYTGPMTLLNGQRLLGEGMSVTLATAAGITPPAGSDALPTTTLANRPSWTSGGTTLTLGSGNTLRGFNIGDSTTAKISGTSFGTLTVNEVALSGAGKALNLTTGAFSGSSAFDSIASTSSATQGISLAGITGGTLTIGGTTISGATTQAILVGTTQANVNFGNTSVAATTDGISLQNNSAGTRSFGTLSITNGSGVGFLHGAAGGLASITGATAITNPGAECIFIQGAAASNGVTFANVNCTQSGATGVRLLTNAAPIAFAGLDISPDAGIPALLATDNTATLTTTGGTLNAVAANAVQISGASTASRTPLAMVLTNVTSNGGTNNVALSNVSGSLAMNGGALTAATAAAFTVNGSTATVSYAGAINNSNNGIVLSNNGGGTINFTGGMALNTGANAAFTATGGGTVSATQNNTSILNTLATTTGTALNVTGTTIGASGLTFRSITANGSSANAGIILDTTGATGGLTVTGNGGACTSAATCSGGTIATKTGANTTAVNANGVVTATAGAPTGVGIFLRSTQNISLTRMQLNDFSNYSIFGQSVLNFTLDNSNLTGTSGDTVTSPSPPEGSIFFTDLTGNAAVTNSIVSNTMPTNSTRITDTIHVMNNGGTLTLFNIDNCTVSNRSPATNTGGKDAVFFGTPSGQGSGAMNLTINGSRIDSAYQFLLQVNVQGSASSIVNLTNNTFTDVNEAIANGIASAGGGINLTGGGTDVYVKYYINMNSFRHNSGSNPGATNAGALLITGIASQTGTFEGRILNNTFGALGVARSGAGNAADALRIFASGNNGTHGNSKVLVQNNTISNYGEVGIQFNARQGNAGMDATVLGNTMTQPGPAAQGAFGAIWVNVGALAADTNTMNIAIGGTTLGYKNTMQNSDPNNSTDVFLDRNTCAGCASTLNLYRNGSLAAGSGESLVRQILVDDNNATLDLLAGFTNGSTIGIQNGLPPLPP